jgi:hypothetical protein
LIIEVVKVECAAVKEQKLWLLLVSERSYVLNISATIIKIIRQSLNIEVSCDGDCLCPNLPMLLTSWQWRHS